MQFTYDPVAEWEASQRAEDLSAFTSEDQKTIGKADRETLARARGFNF